MPYARDHERRRGERRQAERREAPVIREHRRADAEKYRADCAEDMLRSVLSYGFPKPEGPTHKLIRDSIREYLKGDDPHEA